MYKKEVQRTAGTESMYKKEIQGTAGLYLKIGFYKFGTECKMGPWGTVEGKQFVLIVGYTHHAPVLLSIQTT